ncbi:hypothetical protein [Haloferax larsenii]|uniref:hypothetical protein n=1 Tax=Haloferax larsenii TaxID=302484 RepID=UPI00313953FF
MVPPCDELPPERWLLRDDPVRDDREEREDRRPVPDEFDVEAVEDRLELRLDREDRDELDELDELDERERDEDVRLDDEELDDRFDDRRDPRDPDEDVRLDPVDRDVDDPLRDDCEDCDVGEFDCDVEESVPSSPARPGNLNFVSPSSRLLTYFVCPIRS